MFDVQPRFHLWGESPLRVVDLACINERRKLVYPHWLLKDTEDRSPKDSSCRSHALPESGSIGVVDSKQILRSAFLSASVRLLRNFEIVQIGPGIW